LCHKLDYLIVGRRKKPRKQKKSAVGNSEERLMDILVLFAAELVYD
jgi:hypothetical protein